eukprot:CAMPEP_0194169408 /NCGR_PEP_ID=MMETSP0154-20130528/4096_1 /TAXON_ID=1049557 /ORGANISM="Thalassiothrix antarctica, Strain L6-D1" /LENGTH=109 /DNA_ID=CAMNT_0038880793 /DNA_START=19 /DNA_END=344 /DNA_ORIENTATION=-
MNYNIDRINTHQPSNRSLPPHHPSISLSPSERVESRSLLIFQRTTFSNENPVPPPTTPKQIIPALENLALELARWEENNQGLAQRPSISREPSFTLRPSVSRQSSFKQR